MTNVKDLIKDGVLSIATKPQNNSSSLDFDRLFLSFVGHDYSGKTPAMGNAVYDKLGMNCGSTMLVGDTDDISTIFDAIRKDDKYIGGGLGVGFKDKALSALDKMDPLAEQIGSVNFVLKNKNGELVGYNTDGEGYAVSLEAMFAQKGEILTGKKIVVLGAGGTGRAIVFALAKRDANIVILNRTVNKAEELAQSVIDYFGFGDDRIRFGGEDKIPEEVSDADVVLNVSTKGASGPLEAYSPLAGAKLPATEINIKDNLAEAKRVLGLIPSGAIMSDIILGDTTTPFLKSAQEAGFETLDGIPMVVNQGAQALWLLHGGEFEAKGVTKDEIYSIMKKAAGL